MNWGNGIFLSFVLFAAFIIYIVVRSYGENVDLVADDYYAQEINYQQKLQQKANTSKLGEKVLIQQVDGKITLTFPGTQNPKGEIHFYHPSRKLFDKKYSIRLDDENTHYVSRKELVAGAYRVNITWNSDGEEYFQQDKIFIR